MSISEKSFIGYASLVASAATPPAIGRSRENDTAARPLGRLKDRIDSLNRLGNLLSEDMTNICIELDRIAGSVPSDPNKSEAACPAGCDLDAMQEQLDRLDRLAQFTRQQLDRLRAI